MRLALFDLDGTLLAGDSDLLWSRFLADAGVIDASRAAQAVTIGQRYAAATIAPEDYCLFHASLIVGFTADELLPLRQRFLAEVVRPCIPDLARDLVRRHRDAGDRILLTTATNRVVSELTAWDLGFTDFLCTELAWEQGRCSGRIVGLPNMRTGKLQRLRQWLAEQGLSETELKRASFYSDSFNDLALLSAVRRPVVVNPDNRLRSTAIYKGWQVLMLWPPQAREPAH